MREKTPEELRKQEETVHIDRILSGEKEAHTEEEFVVSLRNLRHETGSNPERIEAQRHDLLKAKEYQIEQGVEKALVHGILAGEGNYGLVFRISTDDIPESTKEFLAQDGIELTEPSASKVLKIYTPGAARREFESQKRAYEALAATEDPAHYLRVPHPLGMRDIHLSQHVIEFLRNRSSRRVSLDDRAEIIFMEYVEGEDFAERLYDFVLKKHNFSDDLLGTMTFEEKRQHVASYLKYEEPGGKSRDEGEREFELKKVQSGNVGKLLKFLAQHKGAPDFPITADFIDTVERTVEYLHANGIAHNDLHERNVMIGADGAGYLIDFGRTEASHDEAQPDDSMLVARYRPLVAEPEPEEEVIRRDLDEQEARFSEVADNRPEYQRFVTLYREKGIDRLPAHLKGLLQNVQPNLFIVEVKYFVDHEVPDAEREAVRIAIDSFIQEQVQTNSIQAVRNQLKKILASSWW